MRMLACASYDARAAEIVLDAPLRFLPAQEAFREARDSCVQDPTHPPVKLVPTLSSGRRRVHLFDWGSLCRCHGSRDGRAGRGTRQRRAPARGRSAAAGVASSASPAPVGEDTSDHADAVTAAWVDALAEALLQSDAAAADATGCEEEDSPSSQRLRNVEEQAAACREHELKA
eukprot:13337025-Alexandrium_andersonii.AAC.1